MKKAFAAFAFLSLLLAGCATKNSNDQYGYDSSTKNTPPPAKPELSTPYSPTMPKTGDQIAVMETSLGTITLHFFPDEAPKAVENFLTHAKDGYYNGITFHRVIKGFMIQGGDPKGNGTGGESIWGKPFEDEFSPELKNNRGTISMANAGKNTNGSQFFINQVNNNFLDGRHTVFGEVISGIEVVDAIANVKTGAQDKPVEPVTIKSITVKAYEPAE